MAARRGKHQARRNSGNGVPGWVWLLAGVVLGAALFFALPGLLKRDGDGFFRPQPDPNARPAPVVDADADAAAPYAPAAPATEPAKETQYAFYDLLPGREVRMSDAELAATAREEAARDRAQPALVAAEPSTDPDAADPAPAPAPAATTAAAAGDARYILQAGAFGGSGDAEAVKARIAMLGLSARVESAQINGRTVYRVRMGPYGTAGELAEAKQKLANGGMTAMAIRAQ